MKKKDTKWINALYRSWADSKGNVNSNTEIMDWIQTIKDETNVIVSECSINDGAFWFYDDYDGEVLNRKRSFFSIKGMREFIDDKFIKEQPIIVQPEIGYLGIICKIFDGELNFLMQAKIEPGNINRVQISPTIQATKSNFTRVHGGNLPAYFEYFENAHKYEVIYDQIQSEQATRFYKKRNRNMIMIVDEELEISPNFMWMTLGQLKELMKHRNLVNMDTRTVISGIPLLFDELKDNVEVKGFFKDPALYESLFNSTPQTILPNAFKILNDFKMFHDVKISTIPLYELVDWNIDDYGISCNKDADFSVKYYDIDIEGREVQKWIQPLFKSSGVATIGLLSTIKDGRRLFLIGLKPEIGSFDKVEFGPTVQWEPTHSENKDNEVDAFFRKKVCAGEKTLIDVVLSEEGGRFYHEENRNMIIDLDWDECKDLNMSGYIWVDYATINYLIQFNNCFNIQLRNLLSLLDI